MIQELRTYATLPGRAPVVAKTSGSLAREIRGDDYGKLEGYWLTELGPLNQVMHLWSYSDLDERSRLRAELAKNERWTGDYLPKVREHVVRQDIRLLNPFLPLKTPPGDTNIYEYRFYRAKPGMAKKWADLFAAAMSVREKYSPNVCAWITEAGQPNEVSHLWAYPDLNARGKARAGAGADPEWREFLKQGGPLLEEMAATILLPADHSPLK